MRPGSLAIVVLGLFVLTGVGVLAPARAAGAQPQAPTVSFGPTEEDCGSRPEVSHLGLPQRTPVLLVNGTLGPVTVQVGGATVLGEPVPAGEGVLLTLDVGQHQVQLVPSCGEAEPLTVLVAGVGVPRPTTTPTATPDGPTPEPGAVASTASAHWSSPAGSAPPRVDTGAMASVAPVSSVGAVAPTATAVPGVLDVSTVGLATRGSPKGVRLLAAIATICVLGVTAAIIRSIVRLSP